jgi:hypothetical protein
VVLKIPPADEVVINGTIMYAWQVSLEDVGPAEVDRGTGGKYFVLPSGYKDKVPDGYSVLPPRGGGALPVGTGGGMIAAGRPSF